MSSSRLSTKYYRAAPGKRRARQGGWGALRGVAAYSIHLNIRNTVYKKHEIGNNSEPMHMAIERVVLGVV